MRSSNPRRRLRLVLGSEAFALWVSLLVSTGPGCGNEYDYSVVVAEQPDIHDVVECEFNEIDGGWEQYDCSPVFTSTSPDARPWERGGIGSFDIAERRIFGAPFYQMWYTGHDGETQQIGYAASPDGVRWERHPLNPVVRPAIYPTSVDRDGTSVGCLAFDSDLAAWHLWYIGDNNQIGGTRFAHATSTDGIVWSKDPRDVDPLDGALDGPIDDRWLSRVWSCDATYLDGLFHFWGGGISLPPGVWTSETALPEYRHDIAWFTTQDGVHFDSDGVLSPTRPEEDSLAFDREGVAQPSALSYTAADGARRWLMVYAGYEDVVASHDASTGFTSFAWDERALGWAAAEQPSGPWTRRGPVPLMGAEPGTAEAARAIVVGNRVHTYHADVFEDAAGQPVPGIGLGVAPITEADP